MPDLGNESTGGPEFKPGSSAHWSDKYLQSTSTPKPPKEGDAAILALKAGKRYYDLEIYLLKKLSNNFDGSNVMDVVSPAVSFAFNLAAEPSRHPDETMLEHVTRAGIRTGVDYVLGKVCKPYKAMACVAEVADIAYEKLGGETLLKASSMVIDPAFQEAVTKGLRGANTKEEREYLALIWGYDLFKARFDAHSAYAGWVAFHQCRTAGLEGAGDAVLGKLGHAKANTAPPVVETNESNATKRNRWLDTYNDIQRQKASKNESDAETINIELVRREEGSSIRFGRGNKHIDVIIEGPVKKIIWTWISQSLHDGNFSFDGKSYSFDVRATGGWFKRLLGAFHNSPVKLKVIDRSSGKRVLTDWYVNKGFWPDSPRNLEMLEKRLLDALGVPPDNRKCGCRSDAPTRYKKYSEDELINIDKKFTAFMDKQQYELARQWAKKLNNPSLIKCILDCIDKRERDGCSSEYSDSQKTAPDSCDVVEEAVEVDFDEMILQFNKALLDFKDKDPSVYYSLLAVKAMQDEDYQSVLQYCEQGLAADSNNRGLLTSKAFAHSELGQHQEAYDVLRHFTDLSEEEARLLLDSVNGVINMKQTPDAIAEARVKRDLGYVDESKAHSECMQKLHETEVRAREVLLEAMRQQRKKSEANGSGEEVDRLDKKIDELESERNIAAQSALDAKRDIVSVEYERYAFAVNSVSLVWDVFFHVLKHCYDRLPGGSMPSWAPSAASLDQLKQIITPLFQNLISFFQKYDVHKISIKEFESYLKAEKSGIHLAGELTINEGQQIGLYLARLYLFICPEELITPEQREKSWQAFLDKWEMVSSACFVLYDACKTVGNLHEFDKVVSLPHRLLSVFRTFKHLFVDADRDAEGLYKTDLHTVRMHLFFDGLSESIFLKFVGHADTIRRLSTWGMMSFGLMTKKTAASLIDTVPILNSVAVLAIMGDAYSQADAGAGAEVVKRIERNAEMLQTKADELVGRGQAGRAVEYFHRSQRLYELHFPERHVDISEIMRKKLKANGKFEKRGGFPQHDSFFHAVACYMLESPDALKAMVAEADHAQPREALEQAIRRPIYVLDDDANVQVQGDPQQSGHPIFLRQTEAGYVALLPREERYFEDVYTRQLAISGVQLAQNRAALFQRAADLAARMSQHIQVLQQRRV